MSSSRSDNRIKKNPVLALWVTKKLFLQEVSSTSDSPPRESRQADRQFFPQIEPGHVWNTPRRDFKMGTARLTPLGEAIAGRSLTVQKRLTKCDPSQVSWEATREWNWCFGTSTTSSLICNLNAFVSDFIESGWRPPRDTIAVGDSPESRIGLHTRFSGASASGQQGLKPLRDWIRDHHWGGLPHLIRKITGADSFAELTGLAAQLVRTGKGAVPCRMQGTAFLFLHLSLLLSPCPALPAHGIAAESGIPLPAVLLPSPRAWAGPLWFDCGARRQGKTEPMSTCHR